MKHLILFILLLSFSINLQAQTADPKDVESMDAIIFALYDVISGPAGEKRDWYRMRSLFIRKGRLMPRGQSTQTGEVSYRVWSTNEYIEQAGVNLEKNGFFEV